MLYPIYDFPLTTHTRIRVDGKLSYRLLQGWSVLHDYGLIENPDKSAIKHDKAADCKCNLAQWIRSKVAINAQDDLKLLIRTHDEGVGTEEGACTELYSTCTCRTALDIRFRMEKDNLSDPFKHEEGKRERYNFLFNRKMKDLTIKSMTPEEVSDHIRFLEESLAILIFEQRAEIQGARKYLDDRLSGETEARKKEIAKRDKAYRSPSTEGAYSPSKPKPAQTAKAKKLAFIEHLMAEGMSKDDADLVAGFMMLGMSKEKAKALAGDS